MKNIILALVLLINLLVSRSLFAGAGSYDVAPKDVHLGYIIQKIWLDQYALPKVSLSEVAYTTENILPQGAQLSDPEKFDVQIGMERKRPFAVVRIPAYVRGAQPGQINRVSRYTLTVTEPPQVQNAGRADRTTDVTTSALASGTWYKIAVSKTGFFKIDYAFLTSMGVNPANVNPANIRIFGNGGVMLSENNAIPRPADLIENAIQVNGNGDNVFDNGESAVFYAIGPTGWQKDSVNQRFVHLKNLYADSSYYFITFNQGAGLRISGQGSSSAANVSVSSFNYYDVHDTDEVNPAGLGKLWFGEQFYPQLGISQTFSFNLGTTVSSIYCTVALGSTADVAGSSFSVYVNGGSPIGAPSFSVATPSGSDNLMALAGGSWNAACNSQVANIGLTFNPIDLTAIGYLDYIEINARRNLIMTADQMSFRDWQSVGSGNIAGYQLQGANGNTRVWDVTNPQLPVLMNGSLSGTTYSFSQDAAMLHEFAAMNSNNLFTPKYVGTVANQNLHGSAQVNGIIITNPEFLDQANQVADYHRQHDNITVIVATTDQVYNEFSSGGQDISAIRDFARMFYKRAGSDSTKMPKYLLLFGGASYDYKNRLPDNSNFVPVFESAESTNDLDAFSCDDFFGFLDDSENIEDNSRINALDVGVGRLPARSVADAASMVTKILNYASPSTLGPWRIASTFVADNNDGAGAHMDVAEAMAAAVTADSKNLYNEQKVYIDAIPVISTPAGTRCPNANAAIDNSVFQGTFLINYNGHGNPQVWASERILTQDDYNNWNNVNSLPFMVTATCDFGQFDHPQFVSSAENLVIRSGGGVIVVLTTTEAVYSFYNQELNQQFLDAQFNRRADGTWNTFGDASRIGKNVTYSESHDAGELANFRKFSLLGDPMLTPDFPQYNVQIDSAVDAVTMQHADTINALGAYVVNGSVRDNNGQLLTGFNGLLSVSFFDKPRSITTISGTNETFKLQDNLVYKGRVTVTNGIFSFTFISPKDISYFYGAGKISTYCSNGVTDAAGADSGLQVGGFSQHPQYNSNPPVVKAYINDSLFLNGGITGSNTSLFVSLYDQTGINVTGNNVGHDLTAVLDGSIETPYILNDYYETAPNTYQWGSITFPINGLANGRHSITVKAWDVNDNVGEGTVDFIVVDSQVVAIQNLMNYPNPFTNTTHFVFEHNHPYEQLNVKIEIYNTSGELVKKINEDFTASDSRSNDITWDGTSDNGARLSSGVYVYRLNITSQDGFKSSAYQKLVIVR